MDLFTHADGSGRQTWRLQFTPNGAVGLYASGREGACGLAYASQGPPEAQLAPEASQWELVPGQCGGDVLGEQNGCPCPRLGFRWVAVVRGACFYSDLADFQANKVQQGRLVGFCLHLRQLCEAQLVLMLHRSLCLCQQCACPA